MTFLRSEATMSQLQDWALEGMRKDDQSITRDWQFVNQRVIDGVRVKEMGTVVTGYGMLTEVYRRDWGLDDAGVDQVFQSLLEPGAISGWHAHGETTDRLFVASGRMRIVLYDSRRSSPTYASVNEFRFGSGRPGLIVIPPQVWHAVENISSAPALLINAVDSAYRYESPDHYRLPLDSNQIPYKFRQGRGDALDGVPKR
jgi:dTDP-4-dehydrorhamnose 3,5-epimerase